MNRQQRRALEHMARSNDNKPVNTLSDRLTLVTNAELNEAIRDFRSVLGTGPTPVKAWTSKRYHVQLYIERNNAFPGLMRLSVGKVKRLKERWEDGITWDELQAIKTEVGFGETYAIEIYPRDSDLINVANLRHLWLFPVPLNIGWFEGGNT